MLFDRQTKEQAMEMAFSYTKQIWVEYKCYYPMIGDCPDVIVISTKSRVAGFAYYKGFIELNIRYAMLHKEEFKQTIKHELAHIICFKLFPKAKQAHGPEFRSVLSCVSTNSDTYHHMNVEVAKALQVKVYLIDSVDASEM